jgi:hypothetical protein
MIRYSDWAHSIHSIKIKGLEKLPMDRHKAPEGRERKNDRTVVWPVMRMRAMMIDEMDKSKDFLRFS